jgi:hypothetical protein
MLLNFLLFPIFIFILYSIGNLFSILLNNFYFKKIDKKKEIIFFFEKVLYTLFFVSFGSLILNFFIPLSLYITYFWLLIFITSIFLLTESDLIIFKNNLPIILLISFLPNIMDPGYDALLYHIPYQTWIKTNQILIGFSELNFRFSLGSIYHYFGTLLWTKSNYIFVSYLSSTFYLLFFLYLKEFFRDSYKKIIFSFLICLTLPLWSRYIYPNSGQIDAKFGIIATILISYLFFNFSKLFDKTIKAKEILFVSILFCLLFSLKSSGILFLPLGFLIFILLLSRIEFKNYVFPLFLFFIFSLTWVFRGFIISGCLYYPIKISCVDVSWLNHHWLNYVNSEVSIHASKAFSLINLDAILKKNLFIILFIIAICLLLANKVIKYLFSLRGTSFFSWSLFFLSITYIIIIFQFQPLRGLSTSISLNELSIVKNIIYKEIFNILSIFIISFMIGFFLFKKLILKFSFNSLKLSELIISSYLIFVLCIWIYIAPDPRFGYGFIPLLLPIIFMFLFNIKSKKVSNKSKVYYNYFLIIVCAFFSLKNLSTNVEFFYDLKDMNKINVVNVIDRNEFSSFGKKPKFQNICGHIRYCYPDEEKKIIKSNFFLNKVISQSRVVN